MPETMRAMPSPDSPPAMGNLEKQQAVMETAQKGRLGIITDQLEQIAAQIDAALPLPEKIKEAGRFVIKSTVAGQIRMGLQTITGEKNGGQALSSHERLVRALSIFTWAVSNGITAYSAYNLDLDAGHIAVGTSIAAFSVNSFLNNEEAFVNTFKSIAQKYPLLEKIKQLGNNFSKKIPQIQ